MNVLPWSKFSVEPERVFSACQANLDSMEMQAEAMTIFQLGKFLWGTIIHADLASVRTYFVFGTE